MATKAYKEIASIIDNGAKLEAREHQAWNGAKCRRAYTVEIDGEAFEVTANTWAKIDRNYRVDTVKAVEKGRSRFVYSEIHA